MKLIVGTRVSFSPATAGGVQHVYLLLLLLHTLAASFIWGINTLFLLDAGLSNAQAFGANAFFTGGMVVFEVPTGVVADTRGRRLSYLLGTFTLIASTTAYLAMWCGSAPYWARLSVARPRLHVFLRRRTSLADGRADVDGVLRERRKARDGARERRNR